jgi:hypothetical protein
MRVSTASAILITGVLVLAGFLAHAAFPRYELKMTADGSFVRIDRWTATSEAVGRGVPHWAATAVRTPWRGRVSAAGTVESALVVGVAACVAGWRARKALRVARVRRRLDDLVAADTALERV